jgi:3'(2'), 5'-bisphosphate nucleotidase
VNRQPPELQFALEAVQQATLLVTQIQGDQETMALTKDDLSPVTVADFASQALVGRLLGEQFPNDALVAEEDAATLRAPSEKPALTQVTHYVSDRYPGVTPDQVLKWIDRGGQETASSYWTLDPIDGTKGFLRGDQYAIALALVVRGEVQVGVLGCPNLSQGALVDPGGPGSLVYAVRGAGAWTMPLTGPGKAVRLQVSETYNPARARLLRSFESGHTNTGQIDDLAAALGVAVEPVRMDSQAKYALLAAGAGELYLRLLSPSKPNYREKIWDQAAGSILVEEAGGRVTDLHNVPLDFTQGRMLTRNRGVLATNGLLHQATLDGLRAVGA